MFLKWLLKATRAGSDIDSMKLSEDGETVTIMFCNGFIKNVNVACDSGIAIIQDVVRTLV